MGFIEALRLPPGPVDLSAIDTKATPEWPGSSSDDKDAAKKALFEVGVELADLQEMLFARGIEGDERRVLLVLQGMDTSGKGGIVLTPLGLMEPQGSTSRPSRPPPTRECGTTSSGASRSGCPGPGKIGVFDRSHYEDVLIARVHGLAIPRRSSGATAPINDFESRARRLRRDDRQVLPAHLQGRQAERLTGAPGGPHEVLEVQPRRHRRARALGRVPGGLRDRPGADQHRARPWFVDTGAPEVVPQAGRGAGAARDAEAARPGVAGARLRRRGGEEAAQGVDVTAPAAVACA